MSVDLRTRIDGPPTPFDTQAFFELQLPEGLDRHREGIGPGLALLDPRPLVIELPGATWSLQASAGRVQVRAGEAIAGGGGRRARVRLTHEQVADLVRDQVSFMGLFSSGRLDQPEGKLGDLLDWWLVLRAALDGTPIHTPGAVRFEDRDGHPLDLHRSFSLTDDPDEMRWFLEQAGFLHLRGVFTEAEMAAVSADMDRAAPSFHPGDGRSWWATTASGDRRVVRMQGFDALSPATAELLEDRRFLALGELPGDGHVFGQRRANNRVEALFKPIGVVEGISDVPWHKDCSLGRHSYECCSLTVGISVTGADARSGQLRVLAGSHRALVWPAFVREGNDLPEVDLPTATGDVTVHLSCTLHMAQPPVERERRVLYTGFSLPVPEGARAAAAAERGRLRAVREAAPVSVSQEPGHLGG
ncbi:phytanoyl-CoA dioxygenase family protein [Rhabdothermincola sp.]|uniref:phytanoyl-CoA dioxygenase family protein n=1 Tax=Rhabdothermincola sp. TaxID=2820405 RepID=UPI002FE37657